MDNIRQAGSEASSTMRAELRRAVELANADYRQEISRRPPSIDDGPEETLP